MCAVLGDQIWRLYGSRKVQQIPDLFMEFSLSSLHSSPTQLLTEKNTTINKVSQWLFYKFEGEKFTTIN